LKFSIFIIGLALVCATKISAQDTDRDTSRLSKEQRKKLYSAPRKASVMSAILPGLGQVYNKKYWKVPVIYVGLGGFAYLFAVNNEQYWYYKRNLIAENDHDPSTINDSGYTSDQLLSQKQYYQRIRDFGIIGMGVVYLLKIIDANVDAHLKTFDVSDDLGMHVSPYQTFSYGPGRSRVAGGLTLKIVF
jgi:hypothetical protein